VARHKDVDTTRLSDPTLLILASLATGSKHGYAMIVDIEEFSGTRLEPGTLYGAIARLEAMGWIEAISPDDRRRPYRLTQIGERSLRERLAVLERVVGTARGRLAAT